MDDHFTLLVNCLLYSFIWTSIGIWKVFRGSISPSFPEILIPSHLMRWGILIRWLTCVLSSSVARKNFSWASRALILFPFYKNCSYSSSSSPSFIVFEVWSFQNSLHIQSGKTSLLKAPLMIDFAFIRQETPSISFFFARLEVFLEHSSGQRP